MKAFDDNVLTVIKVNIARICLSVLEWCRLGTCQIKFVARSNWFRDLLAV